MAQGIVEVGEARIHRVEEMTIRVPMTMFGADEAVCASHAHWMVPHWATPDGEAEIVIQSFIVEVDGQIVLVDPCVGNGRSLPTLPMFDMLDTPYLERFAATGIRPEDVDIVVCTHLHSDHCGWNTMLRDGRWVPSFPNARYILGEREVARWDPRRAGHQANPLNDGVFERSVLPVLEAGLADVIGENHRVSPSLRTELAPGHTLGHCALHLESAGALACFSGDAFHHPIELFAPELDDGGSEDHALCVATRRRLIDHFVRTGALIVPAHFAAPHMGYLRGEAQARRFVPIGEG